MTSVATSAGDPFASNKEVFGAKDAAFDPRQVGGLQADLGRVPEQDDAAFSEHRVAMVDARGLHAMGELAGALSYLWVSLAAPGPEHRGRLGLYIEEAIELQLEKRGALPPGIQASTGLDASLSDQLYRARFVEMRGIALGIPSLEGITNLGRSLDAEDSAVLRWWIAAAADRPVHLVISNENTKLRVYPSPVLFETLFEVAPEPVTPLPPSLSMAASSEAMDLSDLPPDAELTNVLGTRVLPLEDASDVSWEPENADEEDDSSEVDLPDLDRALGLAPAPRVSTASKKTQKVAELSVHESPQLPLDYESPVPCLGSTMQDGTRADFEPVLAAASPPAEMHALSPSPESRSMQQPEAESADENALGELDEDEFLKTLEEDSAKAPQVEEDEVDLGATVDDLKAPRSLESASAASSPQTALPNAPEPLPTKTIARSPFIRLANPVEAVSDPAGEAPEPEERAYLRVPSEPTLKVEAATVYVSDTMTLAGAAAPDPNDPFNQLAGREWKTWVTNLEAARGPKPLSVIERMFVTDYTRLREAVRRGVASQSANAILDEWQESFSKSYAQAFDALRARGKRPTMVLDIVEMAARLGRLQGAKRVQLLMVDGLRFDLGLMVQDRMRQTADASLVERLLLWSALPTVTQYQLELLGKGPDGLKEPGLRDEPPALVARGAAARVPRRVRSGRIELFKLDVVEDCLREAGAPIVERMDSIADQTAAAITDYLSKQPPRTMVVAFGDHGFALDAKKAGTTEEVVQGGSSPEEVLVPAFAWLTGAVH